MTRAIKIGNRIIIPRSVSSWDEVIVSTHSFFPTVINETGYYDILGKIPIDIYVHRCYDFCDKCIEKKLKSLDEKMTIYMSLMYFVNYHEVRDDAFFELFDYWGKLCERHLVPVALWLMLSKSKKAIKRIRYLPDLKVIGVSISLSVSDYAPEAYKYFLDILIARNNAIAFVTYRYMYIPVTFIFNYNATSGTYMFIKSIIEKYANINIDDYYLRNRIDNIRISTYRSLIKVVDSLFSLLYNDLEENYDVEYNNGVFRLIWSKASRKHSHVIKLEIDFYDKIFEYNYDGIFTLTIKGNRISRDIIPYFGYRIQQTCYESIFNTLLTFLNEECSLDIEEETKLRYEILSQIDDEKREVTDDFWKLLKEYIDGFIISEDD